MQILLIAAAMSLTLVAPLAIVLAEAPRIGAPVLVILPPWQEAGPTVLAAGGQMVGPIAAPFATLAYSDDPDFAAKLTRAGAFAVRGGQRLADLCGVI